MQWKPLCVALACAATPLVAQQPARPMGPGPTGYMMGDPMGMQQMMAPMMRTMLYAPQHLLARKDALGLSGEQVTRLTKLRDVTKTGQDAALAEAKPHVQALEQAADAVTPDSAALKLHFQAAHAAMGRAHWLLLMSAVQAKAMLTEAQRATLKAWADSMQAWTEQHRKMMQPGHQH